jgi:simple sugar transport system ATP-binding protein
VRENIILVLQAKRGWLRKLSFRSQSALAGDLASRLRIHPPDLEGSIDRLSGGNQQKALIARWLAVEPALLMLDEPTRGIDVGAKFEIMSLVEELRQDGGAVIFVSSELPEVVRTSTKVLVLRDRKAVGMLEGGQVSEERVVREIAEGGA